ncbi:hypothetical protein [Catalinimonas niigatensis]|uniref:hypothetical protein n=1 Tax=Catalinimonas niigatensis TaxID=1397264 RepID=UPI002666FD3C|nr:hypothetical protein [Catalinimonas niigatensis]WPP51185.1 hypothetical protein PZB72_02120 [Catalinimonas niigatensis]
MYTSTFMDTTLLIVVTCIILLLLLMPLLFFVRRRVDIGLEDDVLILKYPLSTKRIDLDKELEHWKVQQAYYLRWGVFYSINMMFKNGKQRNISSLFNQGNYALLYDFLNSRFKDRRKPE